jgi:hypothetical protein
VDWTVEELQGIRRFGKTRKVKKDRAIQEVQGISFCIYDRQIEWVETSASIPDHLQYSSRHPRRK